MNWSDTKVKFEPWTGTQYKQGIEGQRVLVLGESHYHSCDKDKECTDDISGESHHRNLTRDVVEHWKDKSHKSSVSYKIPKLFRKSKSEFWDSVIFYNYLQEFAGPGAGHRPKAKQWDDKDSAAAFQSVLDTYNPDRILVLGKDTWTYLPSNEAALFRTPIPEPRLQLQNNIGSRNAGDEVAYWYSSRFGNLALAMPVVHPSAIFSAPDWFSSIDLWLKLSLPSA
jgi:hypothetical protein